jgi:hypothetical protein
MRGAILPLLQYAFMAWCSDEAQGNFTFYIYIGLQIGYTVNINVGPLIFKPSCPNCFVRKSSSVHVTINISEEI